MGEPCIYPKNIAEPIVICIKLFLKYLIAIVSGMYLNAISSHTGAKTQARKNLPSVMSEVGSTSNPIKRNSAKKINLHQATWRANTIKMSLTPFCNFFIVNVLVNLIIAHYTIPYQIDKLTGRCPGVIMYL